MCEFASGSGPGASFPSRRNADSGVWQTSKGDANPESKLSFGLTSAGRPGSATLQMQVGGDSRAGRAGEWLTRDPLISRFRLPDGKLARTIVVFTQHGCQQTTEFAAISANRAAEGNQHHGDSNTAVHD